jgi:hypothetical protein
MSSMWKNFRTNMMYWRFRHITRNRLRLRNWWLRHRPSRGTTRTTMRNVTYSGVRGRGSASVVYRGSSRRSWIALAAMVIALTALEYGGGRSGLDSTLQYILGTLVVVGTIYYALRGFG